MKEVSVKVQSDYLQRMVTMRNPVLAVAELIWNSLDAEAQTVQVFLSTNELGGVEKITVSDDGHGIDYEHAIPCPSPKFEIVEKN
ncbi:MAG: ATP-binding protein [Pyrinomonadaceae bacterium]|jgi:sensor histidine kinase regulating citrate/malate metabolism|nr:ATP-binding protein [Pyrinomonadaceae bacterium]